MNIDLTTTDGPDPTSLVQQIMARRPSKEEWVAYNAIMRIHRNAAPHHQRQMVPLIEIANRRMAKYKAAEQRRITGKAA